MYLLPLSGTYKYTAYLQSKHEAVAFSCRFTLKGVGGERERERELFSQLFSRMRVSVITLCCSGELSNNLSPDMILWG